MSNGSANMRQTAKASLARLIDRYKTFIARANRDEISEESIRTWLNELLQIFGWDVQNTNQVLQERVLQGAQRERLIEINSPHRRPDYTLKNGLNIKTFLDAKALNVDVFSSSETAYQIRSYGWSAQSPCAFVSNFEQFVIFDCRFAPSPDQDAHIGAIQLTIDQYLDEFDLLFDHLWKDYVWNNKLVEIYQLTAVEGNNRLDTRFMHVLSDFRIKLAQNLVDNENSCITDDIALNYYVQVILDRIIFIRVCESKEIEELEKLRGFLNNDTGFWNGFKESCYMEFYQHYDGAMFERDQHFQEIVLDNDIFSDFIEKLYYPHPYKFDVIPVKVIANIYEEFLGKHLLLDGQTVIEKTKPEYIKTNGAISTPEHIVDMVCKKAISLNNLSTVEDLLNIKILDPCCGSGVFLVACYELLAAKLQHLISQNADMAIRYRNYFALQDGAMFLTIEGKRAIITNCLHGVDSDEAALEVAKMALALKVIDVSNTASLTIIGAFGDKILQDISCNIKLGNSLVDTDIVLSADLALLMKPFDMKTIGFPSVFNDKGGFDYVIGNPPYVETKHYKNALPEMHNYISEKYSAFEGKADLAVIFIERGLSILNDTGKLGFIVQRRWFKTDYGRATRELIDSGKHLSKLIDFEATDIFYRRITYVSLLVLSKRPFEEFEYSYLTGDANRIQSLFENCDEQGNCESHMCRYIPNDGASNEVWAYESYDIISLKRKLCDRFGTLAEYNNLHVKDGIQALWKKVYHITDAQVSDGVVIGKNGFNETVLVEGQMVRAVVYNKMFYPFKEVEPDAFCIFPYTGTQNDERVSMSIIQAIYPLLYQYLISQETRIKENVKYRIDDEYWHTFTREHNHSSYHVNKIIVPMTAKDTIATYVKDRGLFMDNANVWFITIDNSSDIIMKAVACIINSTIFSVLAKAGANPQSGGYFKFNRQFLDPVPFPSDNVIETNDQIIRLGKLHDEIIALQRQWVNCIPAQKEFLSDSLMGKWNELDYLCECLYELNRSECELINKFGRTVSRVDLLSGVN